jgi:hypothetical protein
VYWSILILEWTSATWKREWKASKYERITIEPLSKHMYYLAVLLWWFIYGLRHAWACISFVLIVVRTRKVGETQLSSLHWEGVLVSD